MVNAWTSIVLHPDRMVARTFTFIFSLCCTLLPISGHATLIWEQLYDFAPGRNLDAPTALNITLLKMTISATSWNHSQLRNCVFASFEFWRQNVWWYYCISLSKIQSISIFIYLLRFRGLKMFLTSIVSYYHMITHSSCKWFLSEQSLTKGDISWKHSVDRDIFKNCLIRTSRCYSVRRHSTEVPGYEVSPVTISRKIVQHLPRFLSFLSQ